MLGVKQFFLPKWARN